MEQAVFISKTENLKYVMPQYSRIYFGNEFCEHLVPTLTELKQVLSFALENGMDFTMVSPYITDKGLKRLSLLLDEIALSKPDSEVVFNDYGVLRLLNSRYSMLEPVMGRLLNRMKRGPRLMMVIDKLPETTVDYFQSSNVNVPAMVQFLSGLGVRRVGFDNVLQGINVKLEKLSGSLYVPFAYITTTRLCLTNGCDDPEKEELVGIFPCQRECQKYTFYMSSEIMPVMLIRKGNTLFFENGDLSGNIEEQGINRIVTQPEIPM